MKNASWDGLVKMTERVLKKNSPGVLTGVGIAGMITATILAVRATPKAMRLIDRERDRREKESGNGAVDPMTNIEVVKIAWKPYVPSVVTCAVSVGCLIGACSVSGKRNAALATAYQLSESAFKTYREKVVETIGEKKEGQVRDEVVKDQMQEAYKNPGAIIITGGGDTQCYDCLSKQKFTSSIETIRKIQNDFNFLINSRMYMSVDEFYDMLDLGHLPGGVGEELGWSQNRGLMDIRFVPVLIEGIPCVGVDFSNEPPRYGFKEA